MSKSDCINARCSHYAGTGELTLVQVLTEGIVQADGSILWLPEKVHTSRVSEGWMAHLINTRGGDFDQNDRYIYPGRVDDQVWALQWFAAPEAQRA